MSLTATQLVTVSEITQETYATIVSRASSLNFSAEEEEWVADRVDLWDDNKDKLKVKLEGGSSGVKYEIQPLLNDIRGKVRKMFGFPIYSEDVYPTSGAVCNRFVF